MSRPRTYDEDAVVEAAKEEFWKNGYEATFISDLEECTGLHRSSLYNAFGTKRKLFARAVDLYLQGFIDPMLQGLERRPPSPSAAAAYFSTLSRLFVADMRRARRGCLLINTLAEHPGRKDAPALIAAAFPDRLRAGFLRCLEAGPTVRRAGSARIKRQSAILAAGALGIWLVVRADPREAVALCDAIAADTKAWPRPLSP